MRDRPAIDVAHSAFCREGVKFAFLRRFAVTFARQPSVFLRFFLRMLRDGTCVQCFCVLSSSRAF